MLKAVPRASWSPRVQDLSGGFAVAAGAFGEFLLTAGAVYGGNELLGRLGDRLGPGWRDVLQGGTGLLGAGLTARAATREQPSRGCTAGCPDCYRRVG